MLPQLLLSSLSRSRAGVVLELPLYLYQLGVRLLHSVRASSSGKYFPFFLPGSPTARGQWNCGTRQGACAERRNLCTAAAVILDSGTYSKFKSSAGFSM